MIMPNYSWRQERNYHFDDEYLLLLITNLIIHQVLSNIAANSGSSEHVFRLKLNLVSGQT